MRNQSNYVGVTEREAAEIFERKLAPLCELNNISDKLEHLVRRVDGRLYTIDQTLNKLLEVLNDLLSKKRY